MMKEYANIAGTLWLFWIQASGPVGDVFHNGMWKRILGVKGAHAGPVGFRVWEGFLDFEWGDRIKFRGTFPLSSRLNLCNPAFLPRDPYYREDWERRVMAGLRQGQDLICPGPRVYA